MSTGGGFIKYIKKAFKYRWNLAALAGGFFLAIASGRPEIAFSVLAALEFVYLAGMIAQPRFRKAVDAEKLKALRMRQAKESTKKAQQIATSLNRDDRRQFKKLRNLCADLQRISRGLKRGLGPEDEVIASMQNDAINRLLWVYLKLLFSKNALEKFFETVDEKEIVREIRILRDRVTDFGPIDDDTSEELRQRRSLEDTLQTSEMRFENYQRAIENHSFVKLEIERLYSKISSLSEMSINRQDPDFITNEVDMVTNSVLETEKAISELEYITGLSSHEEVPPILLDREMSITLGK